MPPIQLKWSDWTDWIAILEYSESEAIDIPVKRPGVYEVRLKNEKECLTIGKTTGLRGRIQQALVMGKRPHSSGKRIRKNEDVSNIEIRWAETCRPCAAEEELHNLHRVKFSRLPQYTKRT